MDRLNGTLEHGATVTAPRKAKTARKVTAPKTARKAPRRKGWHMRHTMACVVAVVATFALALSVSHCACAIALLMSSGMVAASALAVTIDCGLVACEVASLVGKGKAKVWATSVVYAVVVLSMLLNAFSCHHDATEHNVNAILASLVGAIIPVLVLGLAKVASYLWVE